MPCTMTGSIDGDRAWVAESRAADLAAQMTTTTQVACEALSRIEAIGLLGKLSPQAQQWHRDHRCIDEAQIAPRPDPVRPISDYNRARLRSWADDQGHVDVVALDDRLNATEAKLVEAYAAASLHQDCAIANAQAHDEMRRERDNERAMRKRAHDALVALVAPNGDAMTARAELAKLVGNHLHDSSTAAPYSRALTIGDDIAERILAAGYRKAVP